jgi:hypothetical protein
VWRGSNADAGRSRIDARAHCDASARCDADANGGAAFVAHALIERFQAEPVTNPPVVISRYRYQG